MHDLLQPPHGCGIINHIGGKSLAVYPAVDGGARKRRFDSRRCIAFVERMNAGIGVVNRDAGFREQFRGGRFAHSDRAGQPKYYHHTIIQASPARSRI